MLIVPLILEDCGGSRERTARLRNSRFPCRPEERSVPCHPEERSDEGSPPASRMTSGGTPGRMVACPRVLLLPAGACVPPPLPMSPDLHSDLARHFGHQAFRPGQEEIVRAVLAGRDVLAV